MRWEDLPESDNVEDRRGDGGGGGGGGGGLPIGGGGLGIGTIVVLGLVGWALGIDPRLLIGGAEILTGGRNSSSSSRAAAAPHRHADRRDRPFVARVLGSTEVQWKDIFAKDGQTYRAPRLVMFSGQTRSACGAAQSAMGPFYCPSDREVYLDTSFFQRPRAALPRLQRQGLPVRPGLCDRARGRPSRAEPARHPAARCSRRSSSLGRRAEANRIQVRVELQADCFAGVWANHAEQQLEVPRAGRHRGGAADRGGDRRRHAAARSQGHVVPDSFTHGIVRAAQALVHDRLQGGHGEGLQHVRGGFA